jgi:hypothetical protein
VTPDTPADEKWRPRNFFLVLICLLGLAIWLALRGKGARKKGVTSLFFRGYRGVVLLIITGILGFGIAGIARGNTAVLRACAAYRVPDTQGAVSVRWMEGQPVRVRAAADRWVYAESPDGNAGWVRQDDIVFY